jgi:hypothetical protein
MKKIYFRKTTEYYSGRDKNPIKRFKFLSKLTLQKVNPKPLHKFKNIKKDILIISSPLKRVSLSLVKKSDYIIDDNLKEILFNLEEFCSFEEFKREGSVAVRKNFKKLFISDKLPESRKDIFRDIKKLINKLKSLKNKEIMVISHSFRLKLIEAYVKTNGKIEKNPKLINKFIKNNERTYHFEEGFDIVL